LSFGADLTAAVTRWAEELPCVFDDGELFFLAVGHVAGDRDGLRNLGQLFEFVGELAASGIEGRRISAV